jgi:hypothetical protein
MIVPDVLGIMPSSAIMLAVVQFPLYGAVLSVAGRKGHLRLAALVLFGIHTLAVIVTFLVLG